MRVIMVNSRADAQNVASRLARERIGRPADEIEKLNPHVDFTRIEPGTVILIPDRIRPAGERAPDAADDDKDRSVQGRAFDDLREQVSTALEASGARVRRGYDALANDAKEIGALLKSAPMKRAMEADPELKQQAEAAAAVFKQDQADAKAAEQSLKTIESRMQEELAALAKLLG
jgi:hypothetical protein